MSSELTFSHKKIHLCATVCSFLFMYTYCTIFPISLFSLNLCVQLTAVAFIVHLFTHIAAVTIDPADASVRAKRSYSSPMPLFDRTKQLHVIQDLRCYLCDVKVYVSKAILTNVIFAFNRLSFGNHEKEVG